MDNRVYAEPMWTAGQYTQQPAAPAEGGTQQSSVYGCGFPNRF
ncbi:hypothetical protein [Arcanobacterium sp. S3PF19]|nr:hypothetical protein [Arcanobacterium sp. S3PF19]